MPRRYDFHGSIDNVLLSATGGFVDWTAYEKLLEALRDCAEYFEQRSDIADEHNEDGSPRPNEEMRMLAMIQTALA